MHQERQERRGRLKIFMGFAAGVGKTYEMLCEANRRKQRGGDVVIGYIETHKRAGTEEQLGDLEIVPRKKIDYRGTNAPGSAREKRWQDVEVLLDAGINVLTTLNVQHLESLNDTVYEITGVRVRETVPDRIVREADEVKMVDITPRALINRLERGDIYARDKVQQALGNWFREGNLSALREIALREIAQEVEDDISAYRKEKHVTEPWNTKDRIMVCISPDRSSMRLIRRGWRISQRLHAEIIAVYVESRPLNDADKEILKNDFALADRLNIPVVTLTGDIATQLIQYARENRITQIVLGHSDRTRWQEFLHGSIVNRLTDNLRTIDILLVAAEEEN
jgi:two-component system sensor histidine kinase KdpD